MLQATPSEANFKIKKETIPKQDLTGDLKIQSIIQTI
jgi:hypothetical protein